MRVQKVNKLSGIEAFKSQIIEKKGRFLIDFWGPSCAPCIDLNRALETLEGDYKDRLTFFKVNADEEIDIATHLGVRGLPTLLFIEEGQVSHRWIGAMTAPALKKNLDKALKK
jgi:thioredoxin 1